MGALNKRLRVAAFGPVPIYSAILGFMALLLVLGGMAAPFVISLIFFVLAGVFIILSFFVFLMRRKLLTLRVSMAGKRDIDAQNYYTPRPY